ncbi:MAG TPA: hypothetical protein VG455_07790 [Acidimicrobiales bacterium]|nr:hypothetical protein [Acidimicrobiales bacterium]
MRIRLVLLVVALLAGAAVAGGVAVVGEDDAEDRATPTTVGGPPFSIGLWGDGPYTAEQVPRAMAMIADMNAAGLAFSVFDGDIKGGAPCADRFYTEARGRFDAFTHPVVYVPGDNEWTDCHGAGQDPLERLAHVRETFFFSPAESLGQRRMPVEHQEAPYVENSRWQMGGVVFVGLNVPGSNNGKVDDPDRPPAGREAANAEFRARDAANLEWLASSFALARESGAAGVMVFIHANPGFEAVDRNLRTFLGLDGFDAFLAALRDETVRFRRPVALVHGDTHTYRLDRPMRDAEGRPVPNFVRCETFGYPDLGWVKATVDHRDPDLFRFEPQRLY